MFSTFFSKKMNKFEFFNGKIWVLRKISSLFFIFFDFFWFFPLKKKKGETMRLFQLCSTSIIIFSKNDDWGWKQLEKPYGFTFFFSKPEMVEKVGKKRFEILHSSQHFLLKIPNLIIFEKMMIEVEKWKSLIVSPFFFFEIRKKEIKKQQKKRFDILQSTQNFLLKIPNLIIFENDDWCPKEFEKPYDVHLFFQIKTIRKIR